MTEPDEAIEQTNEPEEPLDAEREALLAECEAKLDQEEKPTFNQVLRIALAWAECIKLIKKAGFDEDGVTIKALLDRRNRNYEWGRKNGIIAKYEPFKTIANRTKGYIKPNQDVMFQIANNIKAEWFDEFVKTLNNRMGSRGVNADIAGFMARKVDLLKTLPEKPKSKGRRLTGGSGGSTQGEQAAAASTTEEPQELEDDSGDLPPEDEQTSHMLMHYISQTQGHIDRHHNHKWKVKEEDRNGIQKLIDDLETLLKQ